MNRMQVGIVNKQSLSTADEVFESIHTVMHLFRGEQYRVLRDGPHDLTHMEGKILGFFARNPGATLRDLTAHFGRDKGQLARLIKTVKDQGLLAGQESEGDRRRVKLHLTDRGRAVHQSLQRQLGSLAKVAIEGLTAEECRRLTDLLHRVQTNLEAASREIFKP